MNKLAKKAGLSPSLSQVFMPFLVAPFFLFHYGTFVVLASFLLVLRLPHAVFWWFGKERQKRLRGELPLIINEILWKSKHTPLQDVISDLGGEVGKTYSDFEKSYKSGKSFESSLDSCAVFPELVELNKRLKTMYRTGRGRELLNLYSKKLMGENLAQKRNQVSRMQIFAVAYTTVSAIFPSMYSGLSIYSQDISVFVPALFLSSLLVVLWKVVY